MPQLDFSTYFSQIFWLVVVFAPLFLAVRFWVVPRMSGLAARRESDLADTLGRAERLRGEAEKLRAHYEATMQETRVKARELVRRQVSAAEAQAAAKMAELDARLRNKLRESDARLRKLAEQTLKEASERKLVESLAAKAVVKVVGDG